MTKRPTAPTAIAASIAAGRRLEAIARRAHIAPQLEELARQDAQTEDQEHRTRVGDLSRQDLWDLGQIATDPGAYDLEQSPQRGETFEQWAARVDWQP